MKNKIEEIKKVFRDKLKIESSPEGRTVITDGYACIMWQSGDRGEMDLIDDLANFEYSECFGFEFPKLDDVEREFYEVCFGRDCDDCKYVVEAVCETCGQHIEDTVCSKNFNCKSDKREFRFGAYFNKYSLHTMSIISDIIGEQFKTYINTEKRIIKFQYDGMFAGYLIGLNLPAQEAVDE